MPLSTQPFHRSPKSTATLAMEAHSPRWGKNRYPKWTRSLTAFGIYASDIIVLEISNYLQAYLNSLPYCSSERKTFLETPGARAFQASAQHSSLCQTSIFAWLINKREPKEKHYDIDTVNCKRSMLWAAIPCVPSSVSYVCVHFPKCPGRNWSTHHDPRGGSQTSQLQLANQCSGKTPSKRLQCSLTPQ